MVFLRLLVLVRYLAAVIHVQTLPHTLPHTRTAECDCFVGK